MSSTAQEVNELVQLFINIGESIPQQRSQEHAERVRSMGSMTTESETESGVELLSFLDSCRLSLDVRGREGRRKKIRGGVREGGRSEGRREGGGSEGRKEGGREGGKEERE